MTDRKPDKRVIHKADSRGRVNVGTEYAGDRVEVWVFPADAPREATAEYLREWREEATNDAVREAITRRLDDIGGGD